MNLRFFGENHKNLLTFTCNSSAMDISERKNHACMIFRTNMFMR